MELDLGPGHHHQPNPSLERGVTSGAENRLNHSMAVAVDIVIWPGFIWLVPGGRLLRAVPLVETCGISHVVLISWSSSLPGSTEPARWGWRIPRSREGSGLGALPGVRVSRFSQPTCTCTPPVQHAGVPCFFSVIFLKWGYFS